MKKTKISTFALNLSNTDTIYNSDMAEILRASEELEDGAILVRYEPEDNEIIFTVK